MTTPGCEAAGRRGGEAGGGAEGAGAGCQGGETGYHPPQPCLPVVPGQGGNQRRAHRNVRYEA